MVAKIKWIDREYIEYSQFKALEAQKQAWRALVYAKNPKDKELANRALDSAKTALFFMQHGIKKIGDNRGPYGVVDARNAIETAECSLKLSEEVIKNIEDTE